jgi:hypothetical protein
VKPLSNLDYLIRRGDDSSQRPSSIEGTRSLGSRPDAPSITAGVDAWIEEALVALTTPILRTLADANGQSTVFQLVDRLEVRVDHFRPVLDLIAQRFNWVEVGRTDRKGDDVVRLTPKGEKYLQSQFR